MKKIYSIIAGIFLFVSGTQAQTYIQKDFEDSSLTSGGWTTQIVVDSVNWKIDVFSGNKYAKVSNYYAGTGNVPAETWYISPAIDLSAATSPKLYFDNQMKYAGDSLTLLVSTDYDGTSNPTMQGTWVNLTAQATWDVNSASWGGWTNSGPVDLSAYLSPTVYIAFKYIGTATNGSTWEIDNILVSDSTVTPPATVSVYDIQNTTNANGDSPYLGQTVNTGGIVTAIRNGMDTVGFYIQNGTNASAWNGIYVYHPVTADILSLNIGDSVTFTADVTEYFNLTELSNVQNLTVVSNNNTVNPAMINGVDVNSEAYEGVLVKITQATCTDPNAGFGMFKVYDNSDTVLVDDVIYSYNAVLNNVYNVTGVVDYSYSEYKILPRMMSDIEDVTGISEVAAPAIQLYPNPAGEQLIIENVYGNVAILDITGKVVKTVKSNATRLSINLSDLSSGVYFVRLANGNVAKFIKQ